MHANSACALNRWQNFSMWNDVMASILKDWRQIENPTRQSMRIYLKITSVKFHPDPIRSDCMALDIFEDGRPNRNNRTNQMSNLQRYRIGFSWSKKSSPNKSFSLECCCAVTGTKIRNNSYQKSKQAGSVVLLITENWLMAKRMPACMDSSEATPIVPFHNQHSKHCSTAKWKAPLHVSSFLLVFQKSTARSGKGTKGFS